MSGRRPNGEHLNLIIYCSRVLHEPSSSGTSFVVAGSLPIDRCVLLTADDMQQRSTRQELMRGHSIIWILIHDHASFNGAVDCISEMQSDSWFHVHSMSNQPHPGQSPLINREKCTAPYRIPFGSRASRHLHSSFLLPWCWCRYLVQSLAGLENPRRKGARRR